MSPLRPRIAPSLLAADFGRLAEEVHAVENAGADWIHLDVMDGHFVPNLSMGPAIVAAVRRATALPLDVHLMVERPDRFIAAFAAAGAATLAVQIEACPEPQRTLSQIRAAGLKTCVAISPETPAEVLAPYWGQLDQVLVMTVQPGFGGQAFLASTLPKIEQLRATIDRLGAPIALEVDGGIAAGSMGRAARAGADVFVAGTAIFGAPDYATAIQALRREAEEAWG